jgi:hypothetical protein
MQLVESENRRGELLAEKNSTTEYAEYAEAGAKELRMNSSAD